MSTTLHARVLGIDYGEKRVGVSMSDPLGIIAHPWGVVEPTEKGIDELSGLVRSEHISTVVVGMPFTLKGEKGGKAADVERFIEALLARIPAIEIIRWDERFTTTIARQTLQTLEPKRSGRSQKTGRVDAMAASVLLQSFLDSTKHSRVC